MKNPAELFSLMSGMSSGEASCEVKRKSLSPTTSGEGSAVYFVWKSGRFKLISPFTARCSISESSSDSNACLLSGQFAKSSALSV